LKGGLAVSVGKTLCERVKVEPGIELLKTLKLELVVVGESEAYILLSDDCV